jgi:predicted HAD superfamily Cof-like phosphohydrolase
MLFRKRRRDPGCQDSRPVSVADAVAEFHAVFRLPVRRTPGADIGSELAGLRISLLQEETGEFTAAAEEGDLIGVADALADVVWVAYGTALTYGIDLDSVLREVHRSNMSKLGADGEPVIRADGKVLKSDRYFPPDIRAVLEGQRPLRLHSGNGDQGG